MLILKSETCAWIMMRVIAWLEEHFSLIELSWLSVECSRYLSRVNNLIAIDQSFDFEVRNLICGYHRIDYGTWNFENYLSFGQLVSWNGDVGQDGLLPNHGAACSRIQVVRESLDLAGSLDFEIQWNGHSKLWRFCGLEAAGNHELDHDVIWRRYCRVWWIYLHVCQSARKKHLLW